MLISKFYISERTGENYKALCSVPVKAYSGISGSCMFLEPGRRAESSFLIKVVASEMAKQTVPDVIVPPYFILN